MDNRPVTKEIIDLTLLHLCSKVRSINPETVIKRLHQDLIELDCFTLNDNIKCNFSITCLGLISNDLVGLLSKYNLNKSQRTSAIIETFNFLLNKFYNNVWIPRCQRLRQRETEANITEQDKKKGSPICVNVHNLTFPQIRYSDISTTTPTIDKDTWRIWIDYSCKAGKPWQDF